MTVKSIQVCLFTLVLIVCHIEAQSQVRAGGSRRLQSQRPKYNEQFVEEPEYAQLTVAQRERLLVETEKSLRVRESQVDQSAVAYSQREEVLAQREVALDARDADLDQRSRDLDKRTLHVDKRLKEREARLAQREGELATREHEILKMAEAREQEIERLSRERETSAAQRERALIARETAVEGKERTLNIKVPKKDEATTGFSSVRTPNTQYKRPRPQQQFHQQRVIQTRTTTPQYYDEDVPATPPQQRGRVRQRLLQQQ